MLDGRDVFVVKRKLSITHLVGILLAVLFQYSEANLGQIICSCEQSVHRFLKRIVILVEMTKICWLYQFGCPKIEKLRKARL